MPPRLVSTFGTSGGEFIEDAVQDGIGDLLLVGAEGFANGTPSLGRPFDPENE